MWVLFILYQSGSESILSAEKVKAYLVGSLLHSNDGIFNQAIVFRNLKKHNSSFNFINEYINEINKIDSYKIIEIAKKYLKKDSFSFVACGPHKSKLW